MPKARPFPGIRGMHTIPYRSLPPHWYQFRRRSIRCQFDPSSFADLCLLYPKEEKYFWLRHPCGSTAPRDEATTVSARGSVGIVEQHLEYAPVLPRISRRGERVQLRPIGRILAILAARRSAQTGLNLHAGFRQSKPDPATFSENVITIFVCASVGVVSGCVRTPMPANSVMRASFARSKLPGDNEEALRISRDTASAGATSMAIPCANSRAESSSVVAASAAIGIPKNKMAMAIKQQKHFGLGVFGGSRFCAAFDGLKIEFTSAPTSNLMIAQRLNARPRPPCRFTHSGSAVRTLTASRAVLA